MGVRPEDVEMSGEAAGRSAAGGTVSALRLPLRHTMLLTIRVGEHEIHAQTPGEAPCGTGDLVGLRFRRYHVFDKASG